jgi:hypothetical protein
LDKLKKSINHRIGGFNIFKIKSFNLLTDVEFDFSLLKSIFPDFPTLKYSENGKETLYSSLPKK